ncbi:MAG: flagellar biosynthetic protein FliO [Pseudomonadota bacterium]
MINRCLMIVLLVWLAAEPALANTEATGTAVGAGVPSWMSVAGNLLVLLALIVVAAWFVRRTSAGKGGNSSLIRVLAAQSLGARDRLLIVDVAGQQLVVAQTPQGLTTLHAPTEPLLTETPNAATVTFAERLAGALRGKTE